MNTLDLKIAAPNRHRATPWLVGFGSVVLVMALGAAFPPGAWFESLIKPTWQPPPWVFAPVWTTLYALMGLSFAWLLRCPASPARSRAIGLFTAQLLLNAAWTPLFFGLHSPLLALINIALLWLVLIGCISSVLRVHAAAGWILLPTFAWVSFALVLNGVIVALN
jgi:tryptophan-rich sensory protein